MISLRALVLGALLVSANACSRDRGSSPEPGARVAAPSSHVEAESREEIRHLALGDSFTAGTGSTPEESFPSRLAARWRARGRRVALKNVAVNGYTTDDVLRAEIPEIAPFRPTLVTIAIGANDRVRGDGVEKYRSQARKVLRAILDAGISPKRVFALPQPDWSISPVAASFGDPGVLSRDIVAFNGVLREEAEAAGARYVDLFPLMERQARSRMLAGDGLHPSAKAYDEWAAALDELLLAP